MSEMYYLGKLFVDWFEKSKSNGGVTYGNKPNKLLGETKMPSSNVATYTEYDVNHYSNRGLPRIVTGSDGSAWYTPDHYKTWYQIR